MSAQPTSTDNKPLDFNERRTQALAKENAQLREYVSTMMTRLHDNDKLFSKLFALEASVLAAGDPEDMCFTLLRELRSQFSLDLVRFWFDRDSLIGSTQMSALSDQDLIWIEAGEINAMGLNRRNVWLLQMEKDGFPWMQPRDESLESIALLRLGTQDKPFGVLGLGSNDKDRFNPNQSTDFLQHLAQIISLSLEHAITHERLARLAITDALTGTQNRRFLQPYSHQPLSSWFGKGVPVAAMFFDMDDFKGVNDRLGHAAGDEALTKVCDIIRKYVRAQDPLIRMGGDEFTLLLPSCKQDKAQSIAENILHDVQKTPIENEPMSVSIGLAFSAEKDDLTLTQLIKKADKAMYIAKALGGNRIEIAQEKGKE
ncbi:DUF484 family protein [bacterium AH-315-I20]|nr:DUF484 family protein [bacterium AH-315-I20]